MRRTLALSALALTLWTGPVAVQENDRGVLQNFIETRLSNAGREVRIEGFQGALSSRASIERLTIADEAGTWLTIENAVLDWNRGALLRGRLSVDELTADVVRVERPPQTGDQVPDAQASGFSLPELPVAVMIDRIDVARVFLGEPFLGQPVELGVEGQLSLQGGEGEAALEVARLDGPDETLTLDAAFENDSERLRLFLDLQGSEGGIATRLLGLPGEPQLALLVDGEGTLDDFGAEIALATAGEERLSGEVTLGAAGAAGGNGAVRSFAADVSGDIAPIFTPDYRPFFGDEVALDLSGTLGPEGRVEIGTLALRARTLELSGEAVIGAGGLPELIDVTGTIAAEDGEPVLLPVGEALRVRRAALALDFDAAEGEDWQGEIILESLSQPGLSAERVALEGTGRIAEPLEGSAEIFADLDFTASDLDLADTQAGDAVGQELTGSAEVAWSEQQPVEVRTLTVEGETYGLEGELVIGGLESSGRVEGTGAVFARDLSAFAGVARRPLAGSAELRVAGTGEVLAGRFDVLLEGRTENLEIGDPRFDPLLGGVAEIALLADRDEIGTRIQTFTIDAPDIEARGTAELGSARGSLNLAAEVGSLASLSPGLDGPADLRVTAREDVDGWDVNAALETAAADARIEGRLEGLEADPAFNGEVRLDARDLEPFGDIAGRPLDGAAEATATGRASLDASTFDLRLEGRSSDLELGVARADPLLTGATTFALDAARDGSRVRVRNLDLDGEQVTASGTIVYVPGETNVDVEARLVDLGLVVDGASGPATADIAAVERGGGYDVDAAVESTAATLRAEGRVEDIEETPLISGRAEVEAGDLSLFSDLAGRDLAGSIAVEAEGRARLDGSTFDVEASGRGDDLAVGFAQVDPLLSGEMTFDLDAAFVDGVMDVEAFELATEAVSATADGTLGVADPSGGLTLEARIADLGLVVPDVDGPAVLNATVEETDGALGVDARLEAEPATVSVDGRVTEPTAAGLFDGRLAVDIDSLAPIGDLIGRELDGEVDLSGEGEVAFDLKSFDVVLDGTATDVVTGIPQVDPLLAGTAEIAVDAALVDGILTVERLDVTAPEVSAEGMGRLALDGRSGDARLAARIADLGLIAPGAEGPATVDAEVSEVEDGLSVDAEISTGPGTVTLDGVLIDPGPEGLFDGMIEIDARSLAPFGAIVGRDIGGSLQASAAGEVAFSGRRFDLVAEARAREIATGIERVDALLGGQVELTADAALRDEVLAIDGFQLATPQVSAEAGGRLALDGEEGSLDLSAQVTEIGRVLPGASGTARLDGTIDARDGAYAVDLDLEGGLGAVNVDGAVRDLAETPLFDGEVRIDGLNLQALSAVAGRPLSGTLTANAEGQAQLDGSELDLRVEATGRSVGVGIQQVSDLLAGTSRVTADVARGDGTLTLDAVSVQTPQLTAEASGELGAEGGEVTFDARLTDLGLFVPRLNGAATAQGTIAQAGGQTLEVDIQATGPSGLTADIAGTAAQNFGTLDLSATGEAPLAALNPFIAPRAAAGTASFDLAIDGPPGLGALSGQITTTGAEIAGPNFGIAIQGIDAEVELSGGTANVSAEGDVQAGGNVAVSGPITLGQGFASDLGIDLRNVRVVDPSLYRTTVDGNVSIEGPLTGGATIGGLVELGETNIRIAPAAFGRGGLENVIHVGEPPDVEATLRRAGLLEEEAESEEGDGGGGRAYPLDLTIVAANRVFVRGRGLDAELGGRLDLGGTTADVIPAGQFDLIRGRLDILGQRIELEEGSISLQGEFLPFIRLVASSDAEEVTVRILVEGPANDPQISFESTPELPEDEVLAQLLFGRSIDSLSAFQAAELASAVATLSGSGGGGPLSALRQNFGLDDLDVTTSEDGNVAVQAGTYITDNVYTDVTVGETTEIDLNLDVTDSLTVRGSADSEGETTIGIFYERDY